jgi:hypothetical protein
MVKFEGFTEKVQKRPILNHIYHYYTNHKTDGISWVRETFTDKSTNI